MPVPRKHQLEGAGFLASRKAALLADEPRVGKTGASIIAADYALARTILVVTKATARAQWGYEVRNWSTLRRHVQVVYQGKETIRPEAQVVVVGWSMVYDSKILAQLEDREWDVMILDESHEAKNPDSNRAIAVYKRLYSKAAAVWCLSGTPAANAPNDLYSMLHAFAPDKFPESYLEFTFRYCKVKLKILGRRPYQRVTEELMRLRSNRLKAFPSKGWPAIKDGKELRQRYGMSVTNYVHKNIPEFLERFKPPEDYYQLIATGGQNEIELRERMTGLALRRTQRDIGITEPLYSLLALKPSAHFREDLAVLEHELRPLAAKILKAAEEGGRLDNEHIARIRAVTGIIKAHAVVEAAKDYLETCPDKLVIMAWHIPVIDLLRLKLAEYGVVGIDGRTPPTQRRKQEQEFLHNSAHRVFIGQISAAGEAIDLSAAPELWFAEISLLPKDMKQAALRVTNMNRTRQALVRVCALTGSIDEALMEIVTRKVKSIKLVMETSE